MTQHIDTNASSRRSLPLVEKSSAPRATGANGEVLTEEEIAAEIAAFEVSQRELLGMRDQRQQWVDTMIDPQFKKSERPNVTLLISGLTKAQDFLVEGALRGVGYNVHNIGIAKNSGLQVGKEYGNRAQCNPTYFTVGNLIEHLIKLRDEDGMTSEEVVKKFVFLTAGACGPCRFGMYVTEYRKALRDAGFDGFRVMLFQQSGGLDQATGEEAGLDLNPTFFISIVKAIVCGDVLNAIGYRIRPYEVVAGSTNAALEASKKELYKALLTDSNIFGALYKCRKRFASIEVDKLRARPKTSIIGEFWAMTTEGDGNYFLQTFLESEGAECDIQLTTAWLLYNIWEVARDTRERDELRVADGGVAGLKEHQGEFDVAIRQATMRLAEHALRIGFWLFSIPPGLHGYKLPDMDKIAEVANEYYSNDLRGGEGHMEVGKLIMNVVMNKAHMTLSVKPFGCMPSSGVSDGVQSLITTKYPGTVFCAVETSGDGATNFYSRVQMYLYKARIAAEQELAEAYTKNGVTEAEVRAFLKDNPSYASPLHHSPHAVAGAAANLVYEVAPMMTMSRRARAVVQAKKTASSLIETARALPGQAASVAKTVTSKDFRSRVLVDLDLLREVASGKAAERFKPLVKRLMGKAYYDNNSDFVETSSQPMAAEE